MQPLEGQGRHICIEMECFSGYRSLKNKVLNSVYSILPFQSKGVLYNIFLEKYGRTVVCFFLGGELSALGNRDRREMTYHL